MGHGGETRQAFLRAGIDILDAADVSGYVIGALGVAAVCERAGRSPGGFYHHWPSLEAYVDDLVVHAIEESTDRLADSVGAGLSGILETATPAKMFSQLERFFGLHFDTAVSEMSGTRAELLVWMSRDTDLVPWLRERHRAFDAAAAVYIPPILQRWGREMRPPWTVDSMLHAFSALLFGFEVGHGLDPDRGSRRSFVGVAMAIFATATRPAGSDLDFDGHLRLALSAGRGEPDSAWGAALRERTTPIIAAAYLDGGWPAVTVAAVSEASDEYVEDVDAAWGGRAGMADAVWWEVLVPPLDEAMQADLADGVAPMKSVERHLHRLAYTIDRHRSAAFAVLGRADETVTRAEERPRSRRRLGLAEVLARATRAAVGLVGPDSDLGSGRASSSLPMSSPIPVAGREHASAVDLAETMTSMLLMRMAARPALAPFEAAEQVFRFAMTGFRAPSTEAVGHQGPPSSA